MASLYHSEFEAAPFGWVFPQQMGGYDEVDHEFPSMDDPLQGKGGISDSFLPPQVNPLNHIRKEYDYFVNGVISHVLLRIDEDPTGLSYVTQPKPSLPEDPSPPQSPGDLYWGSDLSFGPDGYHPPLDSTPSPDRERSMLDIYTGYVDADEYPTPTIVPSTETPETPTVAKPGSWSVNISDGDGDDSYRTKRKKRRRLLHIIAERNRRRSQNDLYEELYRIVPGLDQARSTKREVLERTADWVERLLEGNKRLEAQLSQLRRSGTR